MAHATQPPEALLKPVALHVRPLIQADTFGAGDARGDGDGVLETFTEGSALAFATGDEDALAIDVALAEGSADALAEGSADVFAEGSAEAFTDGSTDALADELGDGVTTVAFGLTDGLGVGEGASA